MLGNCRLTATRHPQFMLIKCSLCLNLTDDETSALLQYSQSPAVSGADFNNGPVHPCAETDAVRADYVSPEAA